MLAPFRSPSISVPLSIIPFGEWRQSPGLHLWGSLPLSALWPLSVESRMGAVAWAMRQRSDWLHRKAHGARDQGKRSRRSTPRSP